MLEKEKRVVSFCCSKVTSVLICCDQAGKFSNHEPYLPQTKFYLHGFFNESALDVSPFCSVLRHPTVF